MRSCEELDAATLAANQAIRSALVDTLTSLTKSDDVTDENVVGWSSYLDSVSRNIYELPEEQTTNVQDIAATTVNAALGLGLDYTQLSGVLQAMDTVSSIDAAASNRRRRLQSSNDSTTTNSTGASMLLDVISTFADVIAATKVYGEISTEFLYDNFRLVSQTQQLDDSASELSLEVPSSSLEAAAVGTDQSSLSLLPTSNGYNICSKYCTNPAKWLF